MARVRRYVRPDPHATLVRRRPSLDFSFTGLTYVVLMFFMGLAAITSQANLLFGVFGLMIGILFVAAFVNYVVPRRLTLQRGMPESAVVGLPSIVTYELKNEKRYWPSFSVTVAELDGVEAFTKQPHAYMLHAAPRTSAIVPAGILPKRRGLHQLDRYQISTSFPFGFIKRATQRRHPEAILVYPALADVDPKLLQLMRSAESTGTTMRPRRGGMDEFYGVKEHRPGESTRFIYWKRSARTGTLVAKEMTQVSPPKIVLLVDTFVTAQSRTSETHGAIERTIAMAASLANQALETGLSVGLVAWSDGWIKLQPNRGKRHRREILAVLARLPLNTKHPADQLIHQSIDMQESAATMVLFTPSTLQMGLAGQARGGTLVIRADDEQCERWFRFDPSIDFTHAMPQDQEPGRKDDH